MLREGQRQGICLAKANKKIKGGEMILPCEAATKKPNNFCLVSKIIRFLYW